MLTLFGNMFFMHQWLMSFMCVRLPFVKWAVCRKWLLLQWTNKISSEVSSKLSFMHKYFLFFVHYLSATQRWQFWNVNIRLLLMPSIQHWYGKRSLWLWKVYLVIESDWIFGILLNFHFLLFCTNQYRIHKWRWFNFNVSIRSGIFKLLLPEFQFSNECRLCAKRISQSKFKHIFHNPIKHIIDW